VRASPTEADVDARTHARTHLQRKRMRARERERERCIHVRTHTHTHTQRQAHAHLGTGTPDIPLAFLLHTPPPPPLRHSGQEPESFQPYDLCRATRRDAPGLSLSLPLSLSPSPSLARSLSLSLYFSPSLSPSLSLSLPTVSNASCVSCFGGNQGLLASLRIQALTPVEFGVYHKAIQTPVMRLNPKP